MKYYNDSNNFSVPDSTFLDRTLQGKATSAEVEAYLAALNDYISNGDHAAGESYFTALDHRAEIKMHLEGYQLEQHVNFDEPLPTVDTPQSKPKYKKNPSLTQEQLATEIDQLIDETPTEARLQEVLPFLAKLAGLTSRDVQAIYYSKLDEIEMSQPPEELRQQLDELLAIGGQSLDLYEYLPAKLAKPLTDLAERMAIRPEIFLIAMLCAVSCLHKVGTHLVINAEDKFFVPPNLFAGIVAESGQKKSPILRIFVKYPLDELERCANEELKLKHEQQLEEYHSLTEQERKDEFPKGEPQPPTPIDYYFGEGTVEGINRQFERFPEQGMLYLRDELAGVFAFDKYRNGKGTERQDFLSFYDGYGKKELRADGFTSRVKQISLSIFGTIQPDILRRLMADPLAADGQWARFLFVIQPLQPAKLRISGKFDINTELLNPLYKRVNTLPATSYKLSDNAFAYYERHYNQLEIKRTAHPDPSMRAVFSKMEGTIGRLAINLHVIHELMQGLTVDNVIPSVRMIQACKLAKFFINQTKLLNASVQAGVDANDIAPDLSAIVERSRRMGAVTARDIKRSIFAFRDIEPQKIRSNFRQLADLGYGTCQGSGDRLTFTVYKTTVESSTQES